MGSDEVPSVPDTPRELANLFVECLVARGCLESHELKHSNGLLVMSVVLVMGDRFVVDVLKR